MSLCEKCAADCRHERLPNEIIVRCGAYKPPTTNADRIRAMSDEELAKMLWKTCRNYRSICVDPIVDFNAHVDDLVEWLQQPAEEG